MQFFSIKTNEDVQNVKHWILQRYPTSQTSPESQKITNTVKWIIESVKNKGDLAIAEFTEQFDGIHLTPDEFEIPEQQIIKSFNSINPNLLRVLEKACENIYQFHTKNLRSSWEETLEDGTIIGQKITPIEKVGVYVPGGKAFYPSSVLMNVIPAKVAGVKEIIMVSPPSYNGTIHPIVLASARLAGVTRVFRIGGAQSIAGLAYGTQKIPAVDKITGPGNIYVSTAKSLVRGVVEIDCEAGPSEVLVIADKTSNPDFVASELLAQAEHDENASAILITCESDKEIIEKVQKSLATYLNELPRRKIIEQSFHNHGAIILCRDWDEVIQLANFIAPEHLSIQTEFPRKIEDKILNAGAIMLGSMTPVAVGDYFAGPNHILPTGRRARFSSPLTAEDFRKVTNYIYYSKTKLQKDGKNIIQFAEAEELTAHALSVAIRINLRKNE